MLRGKIKSARGPLVNRAIKWAVNSYRKLSRVNWIIRARLQFLACGVHWPTGFQVLGPIGVSSLGDITIGHDVKVVNDSIYNRAGVNHPTQLVAARDAKLSIGNHVGISGAAIYCTNSISIGNHVLIGVNCNIYDTDFHPIGFVDRRENRAPNSAPVVIEDDVWLCAGVTVLKGVTIGARSIVAAGSVVVSDVPADSLVGGVPAQIIKQL